MKLIFLCRVVRQAQSERSFHIFYQLLAGAPADQKKQLQVTKPDDFEFLNKTGGAYTVKTFDDKEEFGVCCCVLF
jgi:myosin heavy subunit